MQELGLYDLTPAMCHLDYAMSEAGGVTNLCGSINAGLRRPLLRLRISKKRV